MASVLTALKRYTKVFPHRHAPKFVAAALASVFSVIPSISPAFGQPASSESAIKVAFLFNFLKFTQWPATAFATDKEPIIVCVLADSDLDGPLDALRDRTVQNRTIVIRRKSPDTPAATCHVTYYGSNIGSAVADRKTSLTTLSIGDAPLFASKGGMVNFFRSDGRLRFEINPQAARQGQIHFSSDLLSLAKIVQTE